MELHLDAAHLVRPDFLSFLAHYRGGLWAMGARDGSHARRAELGAGRQHDEFQVEVAGIGLAAGIACFTDPVVGADDEVLAVLGLARMIAQREEMARGQPAGVGAACALLLSALQVFKPHAGVVLRVIGVGVAALPFVHFQVAVIVGAGVVAARFQAGGGRERVIVRGGKGAGRDLFGHFPFVDMVFARDGDAVRPVIGNLLVAGDGLVLRDVVGEDQGVLALVVLEPEVDASCSIRRLMKRSRFPGTGRSIPNCGSCPPA